ncbi:MULTISPECIES: ubiquinol-cytochrome C chaperone family protein [unclassified Caulobacter]|uniref:ubiquinol-cytochrome C chaperone family protein n=1 Tax=unclassified Caulobacter TaxID=2648921 RepID=UPI0006FB62BD|nr:MULTISPECIES: ubiquinol-cytochrome C chaperone family protein [unclassified Caulobacter]KQV56977.1 ubiquinol-cytochrome C reductase [Caulobacter sp. Root342]KQV66463.1 ubiquinol-cytochrome C reductase [Caulobacter sp. Root343]
MFLDRLLKPRPAKAAGAKLYASAVGQARSAAFYRDFGVRDSMEGRFELFSLHVIFLIERLKGEGDAAAETSQTVFDSYVKGLDDAFREIGVADTAVGKKMKKLAGAFYGRLKTYDDALATLPDTAAVTDFLARTAFEERGEGDVTALSAYLIKTRASLAEQPLEALLQGDVTWPNP